MNVNKEQLEQIIRKAFEAGQNWAEGYTGWYRPTDEQTEERIQECIDDLI